MSSTTRGLRGSETPIRVLLVDTAEPSDDRSASGDGAEPSSDGTEMSSDGTETSSDGAETPDESVVAGEAAKAVFEDEFGIEVTVASRNADIRRALESVDCVLDEIGATTDLERLRAVHDAAPSLPYVVFSETRLDGLVGEALAAGATDYLRADRTDDGFRRLASRVLTVVGREQGATAGQPAFRPVEITDGSCLLDDSLSFLAVSVGYAAVYGYEPAELVGQPFAVVFPDADAERLEALVARAASRGRTVDDVTALRSDGATFAAVLSLSRETADRYVCTVFALADRRSPAGSETIDLERRTRRLESFVTMGEADDSIGVQDVCDAVVETIRSGNELTAVAVYLYDETTDVLRRRAVTPRLEESATTVAFDGEPTPLWHAVIEREPVFVAEVFPRPAGPVDDPASARGIVAPIGAHGALVVGSNGVDRPTPFEHALVRLLGAITGTILDRIDDTHRLNACETRLEEATAASDRLADAVALVERVGRIIETGRTRDDLESRVCERLVADERYAFARIAEYDDVRGEIRDRAWAGAEKQYRESLETDADALLEDHEPMARAIRTREPQTVNQLLATATGDLAAGTYDLVTGTDDRWRRDATARGFRSVVSVPLRFRERIYGGIAVYSDRPGAFDETERTVVAELGTRVGHAIHAIETRAALVDRGGVELEFRVRDRGIDFVEWARETGCTFEFETVVSRPDGSIRGFFTIDGAPVETILELASRSPAVAETQLVTERDETHLFECTLTEDSVVARLLEYGVVPKTITAAEAAGRLVVGVPEGTTVREFVDDFTRLYPDSTLVRRQDREDVTRTPDGFREALEDQLTAKQLEALETAVASGYFAVPRETTGDEVATLLGISQPTFNHHLRVAQQKLLTSLFSDRGPSTANQRS